MPPRSSAKRRLKRLGTIILGVTILIAVAVIIRVQINHHHLRNERATGLAAVSEQRFADALEPLELYLHYHADDPEAILAFAKARYNVLTRDGHHLAETIHVLENLTTQKSALALANTNTHQHQHDLPPETQSPQTQRANAISARQLLMHAYHDAGRPEDALFISDELLLIEPDDIEAARFRSDLLTRLAVDPETNPNDRERFRFLAISANRRLISINPLSLYAHARFINLLALAPSTRFLAAPQTDSQPPNLNHELILQHARTQLEKHPDDPRFLLLLGLAHRLTDGVLQAREAFNRAKDSLSNHPLPPDAEDFILLLATQLEAVLEFDAALDLMLAASLSLSHASPAPTTSHNPQPSKLQRRLIRRLWELGRYDDIPALMSSPQAKSDPECLAYALLIPPPIRGAATTLDTLIADGNVQNASQSATITAEIAAAWKRVLQTLDAIPTPTPTPTPNPLSDQSNPTPPPTHTPPTKRAILRDALAVIGSHPLILNELGTEYQNVGETDLAIALWRLASQVAPAWAEPHRRAAQAALTDNRIQLAKRLAAAAVIRDHHPAADPANPASLTLIAAWRRDHQATRYLDRHRIAPYLDRLIKNPRTARHPDVAAARIVLLHDQGRHDDAIDTLRSILAEIRTHPKPQRFNLAITLSELCSDLSLGNTLAQDCLDALSPTDKTQAPIVFARARLLAKQGKPDDGLYLIEQTALAPQKHATRALTRIPQRGAYAFSSSTTTATAQSIRQPATIADADRLHWQTIRARYLTLIDDPRDTAAWLALATQSHAKPQVVIAALHALQPQLSPRSIVSNNLTPPPHTHNTIYTTPTKTPIAIPLSSTNIPPPTHTNAPPTNLAKNANPSRITPTTTALLNQLANTNGHDSVTWRIELARLMLQPERDEQSTARAVGILIDILTPQPHNNPTAARSTIDSNTQTNAQAHTFSPWPPPTPQATNINPLAPQTTPSDPLSVTPLSTVVPSPFPDPHLLDTADLPPLLTAPHAIAARYLIAIAFLRLDQPATALNHIDAALADRQDDIDLRLLRIWTLIQLDRYPDARRAYRTLRPTLSLAGSDNATPHVALSRTQRQQADTLLRILNSNLSRKGDLP